MQETVKKFSVRDKLSGEYIVNCGPNFVEMGDRANRIIFTDEDEAFNLMNALDQFDDTLPEIVDEDE